MLNKMMNRVMVSMVLASSLVALTGCEERMVDEIVAGRQLRASPVEYGTLPPVTGMRHGSAFDMVNTPIKIEW